MCSLQAREHFYRTKQRPHCRRLRSALYRRLRWLKLLLIHLVNTASIAESRTTDAATSPIHITSQGFDKTSATTAGTASPAAPTPFPRFQCTSSVPSYPDATADDTDALRYHRKRIEELCLQVRHGTSSLYDMVQHVSRF